METHAIAVKAQQDLEWFRDLMWEIHKEVSEHSQDEILRQEVGSLATALDYMTGVV